MNLAERNEYLNEENRQLKSMIVGKRVPFPFEWKLTRAEEQLLNSLYSSPDHSRTHDALRVASCLKPETDRKTVDVRICRVRQKLKPFGISIKSIWGEGYCLPKESVAVIKDALA